MFARWSDMHYQHISCHKQLLHLSSLGCVHASVVEGNACWERLLQLPVAAGGGKALQPLMVAAVPDVAPPTLVDD